MLDLKAISTMSGLIKAAKNISGQHGWQLLHLSVLTDGAKRDVILHEKGCPVWLV
jgi:hypothetical protein